MDFTTERRKELVLFVAFWFCLENFIQPMLCFAQYLNSTQFSRFTIDRGKDISLNGRERQDIIRTWPNIQCWRIGADHNRDTAEGGCTCYYGGTFYHDSSGLAKCHPDYGQRAGEKYILKL